MPKYTSKARIVNYLMTSIADTFNEQIDEWIESAESYIEKETGRVFVADEEFSDRKFDGDGDNFLLIDDCIEINLVEVDDGEVEFLQYPANSLPITMIKLDKSKFSRGNQNVTVNAKWGYSEEPPADIILAATILAAGIVSNGINKEGKTQSETVGPYSVTYSDEKGWDDLDQMKNILSKYNRFNP